MTNSTIPVTAPEVSDEVLREADAAVDRAIAARSVSDLHVLGFGEVSVAIGWPSSAPEYVLKRVVVFNSRSAAEQYMAQVRRYVDELEAGGADIIATTMHVIDRPDGLASGWVVQPLVARELLAEVILAQDEPRADHPIVLGHREYAVKHCTPERAVDLQISNFAYDGDRYVLLDVTSPVTFDADGNFTGPIPDEMVAMVPAPMRGVFRKEWAKTASGLSSLHGSLHTSLVFLHRVGQGRWAEAFAEAFNEVVEEPLDVAAAKADFERFEKVIPTVKKTAQLQRWWQTTVRRKDFNMFITDSFSGELL